MHLRLIYLSVFVLLLVQHAKAQSVYPGEKWPDLEFKEVMNYHKPVLRLSDFKGKALLISVWMHSCLPCIEAFPLLDSMQERFKDRMQVILLNPETADSTRKFFIRKNKLPQPKIVPMVTGEKLLAKDIGILGELWFDSSRVFHFASDFQNITVKNIQQFLAGIPLPFKKRLKLEDFDRSTPLIAEGCGRWIDSIGSYAYFFHHPFDIPQLDPSEPGRNGPANLLRETSTVLGLYRFAFNEKNKYDFTDATTEVHVRDSSLFFPPKGDRESYVNWYNEHVYTYDSKVPLHLADRIYQLMQQSLPFRFGPKAEVRLLERDCWVLEALDSSVFISQKGPPYSNSGSTTIKSDSVIRFHHWPLEHVFSAIKKYYLKFSSLPLINGLVYSGPMNFFIHRSVIASGNLEAFKETLKKNGLVIRQRKMKIPVLVIAD